MFLNCSCASNIFLILGSLPRDFIGGGDVAYSGHPVVSLGGVFVVVHSIHFRADVRCNINYDFNGFFRRFVRVDFRRCFLAGAPKPGKQRHACDAQPCDHLFDLSQDAFACGWCPQTCSAVMADRIME